MTSTIASQIASQIVSRHAKRYAALVADYEVGEEYRPETPKRWILVLLANVDGEENALSAHASRREVLKAAGEGVSEDRWPGLIVDLETGRQFDVRIKTTASLGPELRKLEGA